MTAVRYEPGEDARALPRDEVGWYKKYGVTFRDVGPEDLELLRQWRNDPSIRGAMVVQDEITEAMQAAWYAALDRAKDCYSVLLFRGERIGLTQLRHIDRVKRTAEAGITIWRPEHQNGVLAYRIAIAGMDWDFLEAGFDSLTISVRKTNSRARRFVRSLGYRLEDPDPSGDILRGWIDAESYFRSVEPLRAVVLAEMTELGEPIPQGT